MKRLAILAASALLITGCAAEGTPDESPTPTTASFWAEYPDNLQTLIDEDAANGDCDALQATFDTWADTDDVNADLLAYIDNAMRKADCY